MGCIYTLLKANFDVSLELLLMGVCTSLADLARLAAKVRFVRYKYVYKRSWQARFSFSSKARAQMEIHSHI